MKAIAITTGTRPCRDCETRLAPNNIAFVCYNSVGIFLGNWIAEKNKWWHLKHVSDEEAILWVLCHEYMHRVLFLLELEWGEGWRKYLSDALHRIPARKSLNEWCAYSV